jgi:hypothetical protein
VIDQSVDESRKHERSSAAVSTNAGGELFMTRLPVIACALMSTLAAHSASAQEEEQHEHDAAEQHEHEHEEKARLALGLDLVIGFGQYPLLLPTRRAATEAEEPRFSNAMDTGVNAESLLIGAGYEIAEGFALGLRLPLTLGSVPKSDGTSRTAFALGNLELEAETELELSKTATLVLSLGVALPTAQGSEEPDIGSAAAVSGYDRFVLNRIAASARGFEDNALFEVDRLGLVPKVALELHAGHLLLTPFVKLENLIGTRSGLERSYIAELVFGSFFGYALSEHFDLGLRAWGTAAFLDEVTAVGVVEPQLRGHFAPIDVVLGGIIPFAGELTDPMFGGIRLSVAARL